MDKMAHLMTRIRQAKVDDLPVLQKLAAADDHAVIAPTHIIERNQQMLGYLSVGVIPTVIVWLDTGRANVRDSLAAMDFWENAVADRGAANVIIPCSDKSPFRSYVENVGYINLRCGMFLKQL